MRLRPLTGIRASLTQWHSQDIYWETFLSPSPYGDSCFSDMAVVPIPPPGRFSLRPLTGIRASLTGAALGLLTFGIMSPSPYGDSCFSDYITSFLILIAFPGVSVPLRGFVLL